MGIRGDKEPWSVWCWRQVEGAFLHEAVAHDVIIEGTISVRRPPPDVRTWRDVVAWHKADIHEMYARGFKRVHIVYDVSTNVPRAKEPEQAERRTKIIPLPWPPVEPVHTVIALDRPIPDWTRAMYSRAWRRATIAFVARHLTATFRPPTPAHSLIIDGVCSPFEPFDRRPPTHIRLFPPAEKARAARKRSRSASDEGADVNGDADTITQGGRAPKRRASGDSSPTPPATRTATPSPPAGPGSRVREIEVTTAELARDPPRTVVPAPGRRDVEALAARDHVIGEGDLGVTHWLGDADAMVVSNDSDLIPILLLRVARYARDAKGAIRHRLYLHTNHGNSRAPMREGQRVTLANQRPVVIDIVALFRGLMRNMRRDLPHIADPMHALAFCMALGGCDFVHGLYGITGKTLFAALRETASPGPVAFPTMDGRRAWTTARDAYAHVELNHRAVQSLVAAAYAFKMSTKKNRVSARGRTLADMRAHSRRRMKNPRAQIPEDAVLAPIVRRAFWTVLYWTNGAVDGGRRLPDCLAHEDGTPLWGWTLTAAGKVERATQVRV